MVAEVDELRTQLRHVIALINVARARPTPTDAVETEELLADVETARVAYEELTILIEEAYARRQPVGGAAATDLAALVCEVGRAGDRLVEASRAALKAARRHTSS